MSPSNNQSVPKWFYNSKGRAIAFSVEKNVFTRRGRFLGALDGEDVWNGRYIGSIVDGDQILYRLNYQSGTKDAPIPPGSPGISSIPSDRAGRGIRSGYKDLDI
jgi:hypothetical protein